MTLPPCVNGPQYDSKAEALGRLLWLVRHRGEKASELEVYLCPRPRCVSWHVGDPRKRR